MSKLDPTLFNHIVDFLVDHVGDTESQRKALITPTFNSYESLYSEINWSGNNREFTVHLVRLFNRYGEVKSNQPALFLLLQELRSRVGRNIQYNIDSLIYKLLKTHEPPIQSNGSNQPVSTSRKSWQQKIIIPLLLLVNAALAMVLLRPYLQFILESISTMDPPSITLSPKEEENRPSRTVTSTLIIAEKPDDQRIKTPVPVTSQASNPTLTLTPVRTIINPGLTSDKIFKAECPLQPIQRTESVQPKRLQLEAEKHDTQYDEQYDNITTHEYSIGDVDNGDWIRFDSVDLEDGYETLIVFYAKEHTGESYIQVHLDNRSSRSVIARIPTCDTGDWNNYVEVMTPLPAEAIGVHDIYLTFHGADGVANIDWLAFGEPISN